MSWLFLWVALATPPIDRELAEAYTFEVLEIEGDRALIANTTSRQWVTTGTELEPYGHVVAIGSGRVTVERPNQSVFHLFAARPWVQVAVPTGPHAVPHGPRHYVLHGLEDLDLSRECRALLHRGRDGAFDGFRLSGIRRGTLADGMGLKNGDVVHTINAIPVDSVQAAMEAWEAVQDETFFVIEISRDDERLFLSYSLG